MAKSVKITALLDRANTFFEQSPPDARMERIAVQSFVERVLLEAKAYAGFNYLTPYGEPGNDSSRIFFYKHPSL